MNCWKKAIQDRNRLQGREEDALVRLVLGALLDAYQTS